MNTIGRNERLPHQDPVLPGQAGPRSDLDIVFISASVHLKERITNCGVMEIEEGIKVPN